MNAALAGMYGQRVPAIEAAAVTGTVAECVAGVRAVIDAGAEMILFTPLCDLTGAHGADRGGGHPRARLSRGRLS